MRYVKRIAHTDINERRNVVLDILREENIPFHHHRERYDGNWVENIVVSVGPITGKRFVIGAHYDNYEGSLGANDNASGVAILIRLAKRLVHLATLPIDIVFLIERNMQAVVVTIM